MIVIHSKKFPLGMSLNDRKMRTLASYFECDGSTPSNALGAGNPGEISPNTLTEPILPAAKSIRQNEKPTKKKKHSRQQSY